MSAERETLVPWERVSRTTLPKEPGVLGEATIRRRISIDGSGRWDILDGTKTSCKNKRAKARAGYLMPEAVEALKRERKTYLRKRLRFAERWDWRSLWFPMIHFSPCKPPTCRRADSCATCVEQLRSSSILRQQC